MVFGSVALVSSTLPFAALGAGADTWVTAASPVSCRRAGRTDKLGAGIEVKKGAVAEELELEGVGGA